MEENDPKIIYTLSTYHWLIGVSPISSKVMVFLGINPEKKLLVRHAGTYLGLRK